ncbi:MAG: hypothetical protein NT084_12675 [Bacteroidetes bacterium]|nr:hypothetical protein [Bacteroidota bacterium]
MNKRFSPGASLPFCFLRTNPLGSFGKLLGGGGNCSTTAFFPLAATTTGAGALISFAGIDFDGVDFTFTSSFFTGFIRTTGFELTGIGFFAMILSLESALLTAFLTEILFATGRTAFLAGTAFFAIVFFAALFAGFPVFTFFAIFLALAGFLADFFTGILLFFVVITSIPSCGLFLFSESRGKVEKKLNTASTV